MEPNKPTYDDFMNLAAEAWKLIEARNGDGYRDSDEYGDVQIDKGWDVPEGADAAYEKVMEMALPGKYNPEREAAIHQMEEIARKHGIPMLPRDKLDGLLQWDDEHPEEAAQAIGEPASPGGVGKPEPGPSAKSRYDEEYEMPYAYREFDTSGAMQQSADDMLAPILKLLDSPGKAPAEAAKGDEALLASRK